MKRNVKNPPNCLRCGKQLSFFQRLLDSPYCSEAHREAHWEEMNRLALARLREAEKSASEIRWERCERGMRIAELRGDFAQQQQIALIGVAPDSDQCSGSR